MAVFEIEAEGKTYEVEAPDMGAAMKALGVDAQAEAPASKKPQAEMRAYEPTLRDRAAMGISSLLAKVMGEDTEVRPSGMREKITQGIVGSKGIGHTNPSIADFSPLAPVFGGQEMQRAVEKGNWGEAALDALSVLPATGAPVASAVKTYAPKGFGFARGATEASREAAAAGKVTDAARKDLAAATGRPIEQISAQDLEQAAAAKIASGGHGQDVRLMDVGGEATTGELRRVSNVAPEAREPIRKVIEPRFEGQSDRAINFLRASFGNPQDAAKTLADLKDQARAANSAAYAPVWRLKNGDPVTVNTPGLQQMMQSDVMKGFYGQALQRFEAMRLAGNAPAPQSHKGVPTLAFWDQVKRVIDDHIDGAAPEMKRNLTAIKHNLLGYLDQASPAYKNARGVAANFFKQGDAVEAGQAVVHGKWTPDEIKQVVAKMGQSELAQFQGGFLSDYLKELSFIGERRDIIKVLMNSPGERQKIAAVLGPKQADNFETFLAVEAMMDQARGALGNSTTVRQGMDVLRGASGMTLPAMIGAGAWAATGNFKTAIIGGIVWGARHANRKIDEDVAARVADMLLSKDPKVYASGLREVYKSEPLRTAIKSTAWLTAQGVSAGSAPLTYEEPQQVEKIEDALKLKKGTTFRDPHGVVRVR